MSLTVTTSIEDAAAAVRTMSELGQLLRDLRRRDARRRDGTARTYRELAAKTGWSHAIIGEYFTGAALPPTDRFDELIRLLGVSGAELDLLATARDRVEELRRPGRSAVGSGSAVVVPRQLPAPVSGFVGRQGHRSELDRLAATGSGLVVAAICGGGGVGKTALAVQWAHQRVDRFPDGQLYVDMGGHAAGPPVDANSALERFLLALGVEPSWISVDRDQRASQYRTVVAGRQMLVVLDNVVSAEQVRPLLPGCSTCLVLVTSRDSLAGLVVADGAHRIELDVLTDAEALALMRGLLGDRVDAAPDNVRTLTRLCGRLPLALRIVGELAAYPGATLAGVIAELRDRRERVDLLDTGDARTAVGSVFSWSYRGLSPGAARLFRLLGCQPGPDLSIRAAASLEGATLAATRQTLAELLRAHLVTETAQGRYSLPDLLRAYAAGLAREADTDQERRAATLRLLDHYVHSAAAAARMLGATREPIAVADRTDAVIIASVDSPAAAQAWYTADRMSLSAAARLARDHGMADQARQLASSIARFPPTKGSAPSRTAETDEAAEAARSKRT